MPAANCARLLAIVLSAMVNVRALSVVRSSTPPPSPVTSCGLVTARATLPSMRLWVIASVEDARGAARVDRGDVSARADDARAAGDLEIAVGDGVGARGQVDRVRRVRVLRGEAERGPQSALRQPRVGRARAAGVGGGRD